MGETGYEEIAEAFIKFIEENIIMKIEEYKDDEKRLKIRFHEFKYFEIVKYNAEEIKQKIRDYVLESVEYGQGRYWLWLYVLEVLDKTIREEEEDNGGGKDENREENEPEKETEKDAEKGFKTIIRFVRLITLFLERSYLKCILENIRKIKETRYYIKMCEIKSSLINRINHFNEYINCAMDQIQRWVVVYCGNIFKTLIKNSEKPTMAGVVAKIINSFFVVIFAIAVFIIGVILIMVIPIRVLFFAVAKRFIDAIERLENVLRDILGY